MLIPMKIKRNLAHYDGKFIKIKGKEYYCKNAMDPGDQLFANAIAEKLGIICAKDYIIEVDGDYYYLSYSFNNLGNFKRGKDLIGIDYFSNTIYNLWYVVEKEYPKECKDLIFDLVKVFIFDIFMLNGDRHAGNYAIVEENGKPNIYIFDNESIFESIFRVELSPKYSKRDFLGNGTRIINDPSATIGMKQNMELLEYFLITSSKLFCDLVIDFYNKLTPDVVYNVILEVEKFTGITNYDEDYNMKLYKKNYELIGDLLKDMNFIKKEGR